MNQLLPELVEERFRHVNVDLLNFLRSDDCLRLNPQLLWVEPLFRVAPFISRLSIMTCLEGICSQMVTLTPLQWTVPPFGSLSTDEKGQWGGTAMDGCIAFPWLIKMDEACSSHSSHTMWFVASKNSLDKWQETHGEAGVSYCCQQYIPHNGIVWKVYVLGDTIDIVAHQSFLPSAEQDIHVGGQEFHSDDPCWNSTDSSPCLTAEKEVTLAMKDCMISFARHVAKYMQVSLLGFDIVQSAASGSLMVVDMNYFPSYRHQTELGSLLLQHLHKEMKARGPN